jgi:hypothetical protein
MIGFDSVDPPIVRIQLFRTLVWRVHFPPISPPPTRVYVEMNLADETVAPIIL